MSSEDQFFYTNAVVIGVSPFDVNLKFLRQGTPSGIQTGAVAPVDLAELTVAMSPAHAKSMLVGFYNAIVEYEKKVGRITLEEANQQSFDKAFPEASRR